MALPSDGCSVEDSNNNAHDARTTPTGVNGRADEAAVLAALERGPMSVYELGDALGILPNDAAGLASSLITKGRVVWHRDELKYGLADEATM